MKEKERGGDVQKETFFHIDFDYADSTKLISSIFLLSSPLGKLLLDLLYSYKRPRL
jgi:hypothetical protein